VYLVVLCGDNLPAHFNQRDSVLETGDAVSQELTAAVNTIGAAHLVVLAVAIRTYDGAIMNDNTFALGAFDAVVGIRCDPAVLNRDVVGPNPNCTLDVFAFVDGPLS
jgi:hypothetical protein